MSSDSGHIVAFISINAAPGRGDDVVAVFSPVIEQTHGEEGCISYALHRDNADADHLLLLEHWRSQADLDQHFTKPYMADLMAAAGEPGLLAEAPGMWFSSPLPIGDEAKGTL